MNLPGVLVTLHLLLFSLRLDRFLTVDIFLRFVASL
jgi:hypothetical protein